MEAGAHLSPPANWAIQQLGMDEHHNHFLDLHPDTHSYSLGKLWGGRKKISGGFPGRLRWRISSVWQRNRLTYIFQCFWSTGFVTTSLQMSRNASGSSAGCEYSIDEWDCAHCPHSSGARKISPLFPGNDTLAQGLSQGSHLRSHNGILMYAFWLAKLIFLYFIADSVFITTSWNS